MKFKEISGLKRQVAVLWELLVPQTLARNHDSIYRSAVAESRSVVDRLISLCDVQHNPHKAYTAMWDWDKEMKI